MSKVAIFISLLFMAFALLLPSVFAAGRNIDSYKQSCNDYLANEVLLSCDSQYTGETVLARRKRVATQQRLMVLGDCCRVHCNRKIFSSFCGSISSRQLKNLYVLIRMKNNSSQTGK